MTREQQKQFVVELTENVTKDMLKVIAYVPEEWDGHELRQWIADRFAQCSFTLKENKRRYREYKNTVLVTPGLL